MVSAQIYYSIRRYKRMIFKFYLSFFIYYLKICYKDVYPIVSDLVILRHKSDQKGWVKTLPLFTSIQFIPMVS